MTSFPLKAFLTQGLLSHTLWPVLCLQTDTSGMCVKGFYVKFKTRQLKLDLQTGKGTDCYKSRF